MKKKPARLNRTIRLSKEDIKKYSADLIKLNQPVKVNSILNKIINQDIFDVIDFLPAKSVDLLFVDPPYNMSKKFNQISFTQMDLYEYIKWLDSWLSKIVKVLKNNASIYICGDWNSSSAIFITGSRYFQVQNRITWEREKGRGANRIGKTAAKISGSLQIQSLIHLMLMM